MEFKSFVADLRDAQQLDASPVLFKNGTWSIKHRKQFWEQMASTIYDGHLDIVSELACEVLTEVDPQFDLPADKRPASKIYGKVFKHSDQIRLGLAETLALIGAESGKLVNCSTNKGELIASHCVRTILNNADWRLWGSLSNLLPTLAEAAPNEFLKCVENTLRLTPSTFEELFKQESNGVFGRTYMSGILWALEALAWSESHLVRVNLILAELAALDPGGRWANRPINTLKTILTPWLPQTLASPEKRLSSVKAIKREFPDVAWKLITLLLPNQHQTSSGTNKPKWREVLSDDFEIKVTGQEYQEEVSQYTALALDIAENDFVKLTILSKELDHLGSSLERALGLLGSEKVLSLAEEVKTPIWKNLIEFVQKHKRFSDADWALAPEYVSKVEDVASKLAPTSKLLQYERLFGKNDWDLYEDANSDDYEAQRVKLSEKREKAVAEIYQQGGIDFTIELANQAQSAFRVGFALSAFGMAAITPEMLSSLFLADTSEKNKEFACGFVTGAFNKYGWEFTSSLKLEGWLISSKVDFMCCLPFETRVLKLAIDLLGNDEHLFWEKVSVTPYHTDADLLYVVDKLLDVKRINTAINVLYFRLIKTKELDINRTVKTLLLTNESKEPPSQLDSYHLTELIKALQNDPSTPAQDLFNVEWFYLPLLDGLHGNHPVILQKKLAQEPEFFCHLMTMIYKPNNSDDNYPEPSQEQRALANNAWSLINVWKTPPGQSDDGFNESAFKSWINKVKELSVQNDRLEISMQEVGKVLFYYPQNERGLWLPDAVAEVLDGKDADHLRIGYIQEIYNSRGVHWVDPQAQPELGLAEKWKTRAEIADNEGYPRFAAKLRERSDSYKYEAQRIIDEYSNRNEE